MKAKTKCECPYCHHEQEIESRYINAASDRTKMLIRKFKDECYIKNIDDDTIDIMASYLDEVKNTYQATRIIENAIKYANKNGKILIKDCANCGLPFLPTSRSDELYCERLT